MQLNEKIFFCIETAIIFIFYKYLAIYKNLAMAINTIINNTPNLSNTHAPPKQRLCKFEIRGTKTNALQKIWKLKSTQM